MKNPKFQIFTGEDEQFYFRLRAKNGEIIIASEGYSSKPACKNGIASVKKNSRNKAAFKPERSGKHFYFNLNASNAQTIGTSEMYSSARARDEGIAAVRKVAPSAPIEDITIIKGATEKNGDYEDGERSVFDWGDGDWQIEDTIAFYQRAARPLIKKLRWTALVFVTLMFTGLIMLGSSGWKNISLEIEQKFPTITVATAEQLPATSEDGVESSSNEDSSSSADNSASGTEDPTADTNPQIFREEAKIVLGQHYLVLNVISIVAVMFPALLMMAFAFKRVPFLVETLIRDRVKLGAMLSAEPWAKSLAASFEKKSKIKINKGYSIELLVDPHFKNPETGKYKEPIWHDIQKSAKKIQANIIKIDDVVLERFGPLEIVLPQIVLALILTATFVWAFWPAGIHGFILQLKIASGNDFANLSSYFLTTIRAMPPAVIAVITAYAFMLIQLVRRYNRSDITPGAYWQVLKRLMVVFLLGMSVSAIFVGEDDATFVRILGFMIGIFPVGTLELMTRGFQAQIQAGFQSRINKRLDSENDIGWGPDLASRLTAKHPLSLLDDIDQWDELRIKEAGIIGIQGMAKSDMDHLLIWTPFQGAQIVDWVDQAILFLGTGAEPNNSYASLFRSMGLRGASTLKYATTSREGKLRVVLAAQAIQEIAGKDPIPPAQLATLRIKISSEDAQGKVTSIKDKKTSDTTVEKTKIEAALESVNDSKELTDSAVALVKGGGDVLKPALESANSLQAKFTKASDYAESVKQELDSIKDDKVTDNLIATLKTLGETMTNDPDANSLAKTLVADLDKIATPMGDSKNKAQEFQEKAKVLKKMAEAVSDDVPKEVNKAENALTSLTEIAGNAQKQIKADIDLADAADQIEKLLTLLGGDEVKNLFSKKQLKFKSNWTTKVSTSDAKAKAHSDAEKLLEQAEEILKLVKSIAKKIGDIRKKGIKPGPVPALTMEILETMLLGFERDANLQRIQLFLGADFGSVL